MNKEYICYCGLYCENCSVMTKVTPAAKTLYEEMRKAGFEEVINYIPGGDGFWPFLKSMAEDGICISCKAGGGNPACPIRICAKEKGVCACALCPEYPCEKFDAYMGAYGATLRKDNQLLRDKGMEAWGKMQDNRRIEGFTYSTENTETE
jgi:hypothetical protein